MADIQQGDIVLDSTGKAWAIVQSGGFPRLDAVPADGIGEATPVDLLEYPAIIVAREGEPADIFVSPNAPVVTDQEPLGL